MVASRKGQNRKTSTQLRSASTSKNAHIVVTIVMTVTTQTVDMVIVNPATTVTAAVAQTSGTVMAMVMATSIHMVRATTVVVTNKS
jgi:hypothetical protein